MSSAEFDLVGDLPTDTTLLEASAGTGKTFTIAGLVTRYVAEGVATLEQLLVVTFGRAATQELRDRVRQRLVDARDALADPAEASASDDVLLRHLAGHEPVVRRARIVRALASFDAATVATTHEFCSRVLAGLGTAADLDAAATFVDNVDDLTVEVVQDLYVRMWARPAATPAPLSFTEAVELAQAVVRDGQAVLVPDDATKDTPPDLRHRFAAAVREEVERRKRERLLISYDDLLTRLRTTLADENTGQAAAERLRARYRVVLVDEFQDTDPVQWDILRLAFHGRTTLVLIGDPKQAIYAFRGADVHAYLAASDVADRHATLAHNWRSDPDVLRGLDAVSRGASLGDPRITAHPVSAGYAGRSLATPGAPVRLRIAPGPAGQPVARARDGVIADVATQVVTLLEDAALLTPRGQAPRPLEPGDVAVIVHTNAQLDLVHDALRAAGVPAVRRTTSSVFRTAAGQDWVVLLEAFEQPHRSARVRRLALTPFVGWDAADLETRDLDALGLRLRHWLRVFTERGVAAMLETVSRDEQLPRRLLGQVGGERLLTDLRHVGEALHVVATADGLGLAALLEWLRRRVRESHRDTAVERSRRLDSDAAAVQLATVWMSKGLEFPVVLVPFEWDRHMRDETVPLFHDSDGRRVRDVGGRGSPGLRASQRRNRSEQLGEHLRLLYVALTRAQSQVIAWWAPTRRNTECAPLHRLLFAADPSVEVLERVDVPDGAAAFAALQARAQPDALSVELIDAVAPRRWTGAPPWSGALSCATFDRSVDAEWRRTSYSALTRGAHDVTPMVSSEPDVGEKDDEPETPLPSTAGDEALRAVASPMADLPGGTAFGTLVHSVLENVDTTAADLETELHARVAAQLARYGPAELSADVLTTGLLPSLRTPLGPLAGGRALADVAPPDRLSELDFELPLRGGDRPNGSTTLAELAGVLRAHLPADDPLAGYADLLADPVVGAGTLRGYLGGSIDSVLRVDGRFVVVDYKTNRLGAFDEPLTAWHYRTDALAEAMMHAHYPLQALLYDVALHRFLRWRLAGYDPERHLGGVLYLFLRGMCGPSVLATDGSVPGVFAWRPPAALVVELSDALARGVAA